VQTARHAAAATEQKWRQVLGVIALCNIADTSGIDGLEWKRACGAGIQLMCVTSITFAAPRTPSVDRRSHAATQRDAMRAGSNQIAWRGACWRNQGASTAAKVW
jgi:hypothetical protein